MILELLVQASQSEHSSPHQEPPSQSLNHDHSPNLDPVQLCSFPAKIAHEILLDCEGHFVKLIESLSPAHLSMCQYFPQLALNQYSSLMAENDEVSYAISHLFQGVHSEKLLYSLLRDPLEF